MLITQLQLHVHFHMDEQNYGIMEFSSLWKNMHFRTGSLQASYQMALILKKEK